MSMRTHRRLHNDRIASRVRPWLLTSSNRRAIREIAGLLSEATKIIRYFDPMLTGMRTIRTELPFSYYLEGKR